jgi:drug/metabolite transporter (DMT)-like permease
MTPPNPLKGISLMLAAMALLPYLDVCAKFLGQQNLPIVEIAWARLFLGAVLALPFAWASDGSAALIPKPAGLQVLRGLLLASATFTFFTALRYLPIADAMAVWYIEPILLVLLAWLILGEKLDRHRVFAVLAGFCGTLIVVRPGISEWNTGVMYALASGLCFAFYMVVTRLLSGRANPITTTFQTNALGAITASALLPPVWVMPNLEQWLLMLAMAGFATAGHYLAAKSYDYAEASLLAPLAYTEIIMSIFAGWLFFSDFPDSYTLIGIAVLVASAIYISWRERSAHLRQLQHV